MKANEAADAWLKVQHDADTLRSIQFAKQQAAKGALNGLDTPRLKDPLFDFVAGVGIYIPKITTLKQVLGL